MWAVFKKDSMLTVVFIFTLKKTRAFFFLINLKGQVICNCLIWCRMDGQIKEQMADLHLYFSSWAAGFYCVRQKHCTGQKHYKNELWGLAGLSFAFKELARVRSTSTTVSDVWAIAIVHLWFHDFLLIQHRKITVCAMTFWQKVCFNKVLSKPQDSCGREVWVWRSDLRPIVKHQQRAICTATKAKMRDSHRGTHKGGQGPGE